MHLLQQFNLLILHSLCSSELEKNVFWAFQ